MLIDVRLSLINQLLLFQRFQQHYLRERTLMSKHATYKMPKKKIKLSIQSLAVDEVFRHTKRIEVILGGKGNLNIAQITKLWDWFKYMTERCENVLVNEGYIRTNDAFTKVEPKPAAKKWSFKRVLRWIGITA